MRRVDDRSRLVLCAVLSGCAGLVYEALWTRRLTEAFGHTTLAVATAAAAFMVGLAIGSLAADPLARRYPGGPLKMYALAEAAIGLFGWFSRGWLALIERWASSGRGIADLASANGAAWFGIFLAALAPATVLMGLTLPLLVMSYSAAERSAGDGFGRVYGWNTLGGALGCLLAGIVLPPWIGIGGSLRVAAALNGAAAAVAVGIAPRRRETAEAAKNAMPAGFLVLSFLSGGVGMVCEIAWFRLLQLLLGSSTQTISLILVVIVLGLGLGSLCYRAACVRRAPDAGGWAWLQLLLAASLLAGLFGFDRLAYVGASILADPRFSYGTRLLIQGCFCAAIALPATVIMGLSLAWLFGWASGDRAASEVGVFYGANAAGCVVGSALTAFYLLPAWGMERTLRAAALLTVLTAGAVALRAFRRSGASRRQAGLAAGLAASIVLLPKALEPAILSSGVFLYGPNFAQSRTFREFREQALSEPLLFYADGLSATVTVKEGTGSRHLQINGKTDASTGTDRLTQLVIGYAPLMLNPLADRVLVIGLGTGMTAQALAQSARVHAVKIVELEPRVAEAAAFFDADNGGLLRDPRVSLVFEDARRFLSADGDAYDIITAEPSNPWVSGVASLYTRESFLKARRRLTAHGVFCQWMHAYRMSEDDFRSVLATFASVFPHVLLFRAGSTFDYLLIGSNEGWPGTAAASALVDESPALRGGLARLQLQDSSRDSSRSAAPFDLLAGEFALGDQAFRRYAAGAALNTDDRPILEFSAPKHLFASDQEQIYASVESARNEEFPGEIFPDKVTLDAKTVQTVVAAASLSLQDLPRALRLLRAAFERDPADSRAESDYARALIRAGRPDDAETILLAVVARNPRFAPAYFHLADLHAMRGEIPKALSWAERGLRLDPKDPRANISVGSLYLGVGKKDAARRAFERALKVRPLDEPTRRRLEASLAHWR